MLAIPGDGISLSLHCGGKLYCNSVHGRIGQCVHWPRMLKSEDYMSRECHGKVLDYEFGKSPLPKFLAQR